MLSLRAHLLAYLYLMFDVRAVHCALRVNTAHTPHATPKAADRAPEHRGAAQPFVLDYLDYSRDARRRNSS